MFKISPIQEQNMQAEYANASGCKLCPGFFAYSMIDQESGEFMGFSQFEISGEFGYIKDLRPRIGYSDFEAMFILGRATMNFIDLCGIHICRAAKDAADETLLKSIGFKYSDELSEYVCDMSGMFDGKCQGHCE